MQVGAITQHIDVAQVVLYAFWVFFAALVFYLRQEDRREGYPLENAKTGQVGANYWPLIPDAKTFRLPHGHGEVQAPNGRRDTRPLPASPAGGFPGAPLEPTGDPLGKSIGPGSWAERADVPDVTLHGEPKIVPMRTSHGYIIAPGDPDPVGMKVIGCDGAVGGVVTDTWVDTSEHMVRYFELQPTGTTKKVLLPITFSVVKPRERQIYVHAITGAQFAGAPVTRKPDQVTFLEEDMICGYYGGGQLYATWQRKEPLL